MDCQEFDGQVVRLDGISDIADQFVRIRLDRIDNSDLNLFKFDYDLTFMVFFMNADERIYGRFGGRDEHDAESRMSLEGLRYAMQATIQTHERRDELPAIPARSERVTIRDVMGVGNARRCIHCHQVKEILNNRLKRDGQWTVDQTWRYPPADNLGLVLEVDRGDIVDRVEKQSPADRAGLRSGDQLAELNGMSVHSFADAQFALDAAPATGRLAIAWQRDGKTMTGELALPVGWRKTDLSWRQSMRYLVPAPKVYGRDLNADQRTALGLTATQLAFRQLDPVYSHARKAGVRVGDIVLGFDGIQLEMSAYQFTRHVKRHYMVGDKVSIDLIRDGRRMTIPMTLVR